MKGEKSGVPGGGLETDFGCAVEDGGALCGTLTGCVLGGGICLGLDADAADCGRGGGGVLTGPWIVAEL